MKQHGASLQFGFISRGFLAGLAIAGVAFYCGCSSSSSSNGGGGATPGTTGPVVDASKLGQDCSGGTSIGDSVAFNDTTCGAGVCIVDATGNDLDTYCSADCSNAQCPTGYICKATTIGDTNDCFIDPNASKSSGKDGGSSSTSGTSGGACVTLSGTYSVAATQSASNTNVCEDLPSGTTVAFDQSDAGTGCVQSFDAASCTYTNVCTTDDGEGNTSKLTMIINTSTLSGSFDLASSSTDTGSADCGYSVTLSK